MVSERPVVDQEVFVNFTRRVEEKMDELSIDIKEVKSLQRTTNGRVGRLELRNAWLSGAMAAIGVILGMPAIVGTVLGIVVLIREW